MEAIPRAALVLQGLVGLTRRSSPRPHETSLCRSMSQSAEKCCLVSTSCSCHLCPCHRPSCGQALASVASSRVQGTWLHDRCLSTQRTDEWLPAHEGRGCHETGHCNCLTESHCKVACLSCLSPGCHLDWHAGAGSPPHACASGPSASLSAQEREERLLPFLHQAADLGGASPRRGCACP